MANTTIGFGGALILLGLGGYLATGAQSPTALIPAAVGLVLVVLGLVARHPNGRLHARGSFGGTGGLCWLGWRGRANGQDDRR